MPTKIIVILDNLMVNVIAFVNFVKRALLAKEGTLNVTEETTPLESDIKWEQLE